MTVTLFRPVFMIIIVSHLWLRVLLFLSKGTNSTNELISLRMARYIRINYGVCVVKVKRFVSVFRNVFLEKLLTVG